MGRYVCKTIDQATADDFVEANHRQGALAAKSISLGLFLRKDPDQELLGVLQMGPVRTAAMARRYSLELYRLAFKLGIRSPGGASKLIRSYIEEYRPADFFTYQDTTGENTRVYEHSGMTLVRDGLKLRKDYLVAPGSTVATGSRSEVLGMAYATRYGPDRILGTALGEVFDGSRNRRKSNRELFLEELGWTVESTSGDSIWEWIDREKSFYTYKITATDSPKYYYGVRGIALENPSVEDCMEDDYYGSGGAKFSNWKLRHEKNLRKEIIGIHSLKASAYRQEKELVGESYKLDDLCLNSIAGGSLQPHVRKSLKLRSCAKHGETLHNGETCLKCSAASSHSLGNCPIHGETSFHGGNCQRCKSLESKSIQRCPIHGETAHQGQQCYKCMVKSELKSCEIHGLTSHFGGKCMSCRNAGNVSLQSCPTHGESKHLGGVCYRCTSSGAVALRVCPVHGETKHRGDACFKCREGSPAISMKECAVHGLSKHQGDRCFKCSRGAVVVKECPIHGEAKHRGDACFKCAAAKRKPRARKTT